MQLGWLAPTNQGAMVDDYISTSFLAGQKKAIGAFAIASTPSGSTFTEAMFAGLQDVTGGTTPTTSSPAVITGSSNTKTSAF